MPCLAAGAQFQHSQVFVFPVCIMGTPPCWVAGIYKLSQAELADVSDPLLIQRVGTVQTWEWRKSWLPLLKNPKACDQCNVNSLTANLPSHVTQQALQSYTTLSLTHILLAAIIFNKITHQNTSFFYCMSHPYLHITLQTWLTNALRLICKNTLEILLAVSYTEWTCLAQARSTLKSSVRYYWPQWWSMRFFKDIISIFNTFSWWLWGLEHYSPCMAAHT